MSACSATNLDAKAIEDKYGVSGATTENILTADGAIMSATVVPITLPDGRKAELVIPQKGDSHSVYLRDQAGMYQVQLQDHNMSRDQFIRSNPTVVERRAVPQSTKKRSWEKEALLLAEALQPARVLGHWQEERRVPALGRPREALPD